MKKDYAVGVKAKKVYRQKLFAKVAKLAFCFLLAIFAVIYFFLYMVYSKGNFTVTLDQNAGNQKNIFLSETGKPEDMRVRLKAVSIDYMDNISINWIPKDVDNEANGPHNGENYIAYTFYVLNLGDEVVNYWYQIDILDSIKEVDEAIRIMVYRNGERVVYGKENSKTKKAEEGTEVFYDDDIAVLERREKISPGEKDKYTVVIWLEGDDPDCIDDIIGGEIKMEMKITEEHIS